MKKTDRRLSLRRETLRKLSALRDEDLVRVAGGYGLQTSNLCVSLSATSRYCLK